MEQEKSSFAAQLRAARALCDMSQEALAKAAGVSSMTVKRAEGAGSPYPADKAIAAIRAALEAAGVAFVREVGVRLEKVAVRSYDDRILFDCFDSRRQVNYYIVSEMREKDGYTLPDDVSPETEDYGLAEAWLESGDWPGKEPLK